MSSHSLLLLLLFLTTCASAQQYAVKVGTIGHRDHKMAVGYGLGGVQNAVARNVMPDSTLHVLGPLWASYTVMLDSAWSVGAEVGYHEAKGRWLADDTDPPPGGRAIAVPYAKQTVHVAACAELAWYHGRWLTFSSGASLGVAFVDHSGNSSPLSSIVPAYHVGLVSIRVTGDVGFRLEVGYGYRGIINAGMSFVM